MTSTIEDPTAMPLAGEAVLVASGDLRHAANRMWWPAQHAMEQKIAAAFANEAVTVRRGHDYDSRLEHGLIWSQRMGMDVFKRINPDARIIVAEAVWQYSHHVLAGLRDHRGPILTLANWSGQWPGLVGLLNLNASLVKAGVRYDTIWSEDFTDAFFLQGIRQWLTKGSIAHDLSHVRPFDAGAVPHAAAELGANLASRLLCDKAILGVFDEGCMGMYNAIIDDEMLNAAGIYKERLSQSALFAAMRNVPLDEAQTVRHWLDERGVTFQTGAGENALTDAQLLEQFQMYVAAIRRAHDFSCDAIGIQYQQGLKDLCAASDLVEGLLNNPDRPPVSHAHSGEPLYAGQALPHFNEVDECAGVDALITNRVWSVLGFDPSTTLHDLRWGEHYSGQGIDDFVWVFMISGAAPASHFIDGYAGAVSERQTPEYFPKGGGTLKGVCRPGEIVWSRVFVMDGGLHCDIGRGSIVSLPKEETERRWALTSPEWPIMHAVLHGVSRDQMMARHKSNHIQVVYAPTAADADFALAVKASMFSNLGFNVSICGDVK